MRYLIAVMLPGVFLAACASSGSLKKDDLIRIAYFLEGSFSSGEQAAQDSAFRDIRLQVRRIWELRGGYWLYVEQAVAGYEDKPYRQRIYQLSIGDGKISSEVYLLPRPERFAGAWRDTRRFDALLPDSLSLREGCTVVLQRRGDHYRGGTQGTGCESKLYGASYATSEVELFADRIISWDRGFDAKGNQMWGAETGGYIFVRTDNQEGNNEQ